MRKFIKQIKTPDEYVDLAKTLSYLLDNELTKIEKKAKQKDWFYVNDFMPAVISLVNITGYLAGDDGIFRDIHIPFNPKFNTYETKNGNKSNPIHDAMIIYRHQLVKNRRDFEDRLNKLISGIMKSDISEDYKKTLDRYFTKDRTQIK